MAQTTYGVRRTSVSMVGLPRRSVIRWGGVFAGSVIAIGLLFLLTSLWQALAFSSDVTWFADNIAWWNAASSIVVLLIAGVLASWLAGTRGWARGCSTGSQLGGC